MSTGFRFNDEVKDTAISKYTIVYHIITYLFNLYKRVLILEKKSSFKTQHHLMTKTLNPKNA